jgi:phosphoglycerate dehydrogenase-like enzyme
MATRVLIIDPLAEYYRKGLQAAFPALEIRDVASRADVGELMADVDVICGMGGVRVFDDELVRKAARLKWIQAFTTGTDGITRQPSLGREVLLTSMRGIHGPQMSEMALLLMIALARDYPRMLRNQDRAVWDRFQQRRLYGKTVAILGVGIIGTDLAKRAKAFGMTVVGVSGTPRALAGFDRMYPRSDLERAAGEADFLAVLVPHTSETDKIVNGRILAAMKPGAYLVNLARGGVCDEPALLEALKAGRIAGAALDVFAREPLEPAHPFWKMDNVIVTPHLGGQSDVYHEQVLDVLTTNMKCFLENRPSKMLNLVPH